MLWQGVTGVFLLRTLQPWLGLAHSLFEISGTAASFAAGGLNSGYAAFVALAIYFCPAALALAAAAPIGVAIGVVAAALRRSHLLPRVRPSLLKELDPEKDRELFAYLTQPYQTGRPVARQAGWLLLAPWIFVPAIFWRSRSPAADSRFAQPGRHDSG